MLFFFRHLGPHFLPGFWKVLARGSEMSCLGVAPGGVQVILAVLQGDIRGFSG